VFGLDLNGSFTSRHPHHMQQRLELYYQFYSNHVQQASGHLPTLPGNILKFNVLRLM